MHSNTEDDKTEDRLVEVTKEAEVEVLEDLTMVEVVEEAATDAAKEFLHTLADSLSDITITGKPRRRRKRRR